LFNFAKIIIGESSIRASSAFQGFFYSFNHTLGLAIANNNIQLIYPLLEREREHELPSFY